MAACSRHEIRMAELTDTQGRPAKARAPRKPVAPAVQAPVAQPAIR